MRADELDYELPEHAIAQRPTEHRGDSRLLVFEQTGFSDRVVSEWAELVPEGSIVVLNDTRVQKARVLAHRAETGGKVELLFLHPEGEETQHCWLAMGKANRRLEAGVELVVGADRLSVREKRTDGLLVVHSERPIEQVLDAEGHVPLPPYVRRPDDSADEQRYQTVYARHMGSAAAPTAGLHLTELALQRLRERGVEIGHVTLHVGAGTFKPVAADTLEQHVMHSEQFTVAPELVTQIERAREAGGEVVAVGTTVVRALESAARSGRLVARSTSTDLMIAPGYQFKVVDALLTNFHAPRSTLLALVYAFAGQAKVREGYRHALENNYRFLSYGDAMWLPRRVS